MKEIKKEHCKNTVIRKNEQTKRLLSGTALKLIAVISMVTDHVGSHLIRNWFVLSGHNVITEPFSENTLIHCLIDVCDAMGSIAFPLFCFLAAEGFYYSSSREMKNIPELTYEAMKSKVSERTKCFSKLTG